MAHQTVTAGHASEQPDYQGPFAAGSTGFQTGNTAGVQPSDSLQRTSSSASISSQILYKFGHFARSHSQGSKRSLDVTDEESDTTPTKRAASVKALEASETISTVDQWCPFTASPEHISRRHAFQSQDLSCEEAALFEHQHSGICGQGGYTYKESLYSSDTAAHGRVPSALAKSASSTDNELEDMIRVLYATENVLRPCPKYMNNHGPSQQPALFIEPSMRTIGVSWLVEVGCEYSLQQETLFLATALLDRFLTHSKALPRNKLQLASVACMLIAAKHEEEMHPSVADFTNIADNCFQQSDLLKMESLVLQTLRFRIHSPNAFTALSLFKQALRLSHKASALASYLTELSILEYDLLQFQPSVIAASAILLAQVSEGCLEEVASLQRVCGYCPAVLRECTEELRNLQQQAFDAVDIYNPFMAIKDKYREIRRHCISHEAPLEFLPPCIFM